MMIHQGGMSPRLISQGQPDLNYSLRLSAGREVSRRTWFSLATVSSLLGRVQAQFLKKKDDRLQDGVSPAFLTQAPTFVTPGL